MWVLWIIAACLVTLGLSCLVTLGLYWQDDWKLAVPGFCMTIFGGLFLFGSLLCWPIEYYGTKATIAAYPEMVASVEASRRGEISEYERVALTKDILEFNVSLKKKQYWNETFMFNIFIPDEIMELEPIR